MNILVLILEILGTIAFSVSGVMLALKKKMDLLGVLIMGFITALGGGITRDILLGQTPPNAFLNPMLPLISLLTSLVVFLLSTKKIAGKYTKYYNMILFAMDSIGLGIFTVVGVEVSQNLYGLNLLLNIFMGTLTGVGGGVIRDLFSCQIPIIFTKHFYATASIIGSVTYIALYYMFNSLIAGIVAILVVILLRICASRYLWNLPKAE